MRKVLLIFVMIFVAACGSNHSSKEISIEPLIFIPSTTTSTTTTTTTIITTIPKSTTVTAGKQKMSSAVVKGIDAGDFMSCVRIKESDNNYAYDDGTYQGAYNMSPDHWDKRGGYTTADKAPPEMQDQKFREDMSAGRDYMHQQYPNTSVACGLR